MAQSILGTTKEALGLEADYTPFDADIVMHINAALSTLTQIGVGPIDGFYISDAETTWDTLLLGDATLNSVKQYVFLKVKQVFDPPSTSFGLDSLKNLITEMEWRINVAVESRPTNILVLDGGTP